jgi:hypothetical protein
MEQIKVTLIVFLVEKIRQRILEIVRQSEKKKAPVTSVGLEQSASSELNRPVNPASNQVCSHSG